MTILNDLSGLDALETQMARGNPQARARLLEIIERIKDENPGEYEQLRREIELSAGDSLGLARVEELVGQDVIEASRHQRRLMERAQLFKTRRVDDAIEVAQRHRGSGYIGAAQKMESGAAFAASVGLSRVGVVRSFPIALVGFGHTRWSSQGVRLSSYPPPPQGGPHPLIVVDADTEALLVELDPRTLWHWCIANRWSDPAREPRTDVEARAWLVRETLGNPDGPAALAIRRATHVWSHLLIHALGGRSSFDPNSVAEYLLEPTAGVLIYAASYSSFNMGALSALLEQHLRTWVEGAVEGCKTCLHDPVCRNERGGCHKCLALAFGCERFNRGLERGYLLGGGTVQVVEGLLQTAARIRDQTQEAA